MDVESGAWMWDVLNEGFFCHVVYYCWVLTNNKEHVYIYKNIILYSLFVNGYACVEEESNQKESLSTWRSCWELELPVGTDFSQICRPYIVLKLPCDPHAMLVFHYSWLTPTQCLFFIGHGLYPHNPCSLSVTAYTHAFFVSGNHFVDFIPGQMYLLTTSAGFITGQGDILQLSTHPLLCLSK